MATLALLVRVATGHPHHSQRLSVATLALLVRVATGHPHHSHRLRTLALFLLAPPASLPLAVRRRWPVEVFFVVLAASIAYGVLGSKASLVTSATYGLYMVAVQASRRWSLLALAAVEAGIALNFVLSTMSKDSAVTSAFTALVQLTVWIAADDMRRRLRQLRGHLHGLPDRH